MVLLGLVLLPATAWAHPGHPGGGWPAGFLHPFTGFDHLLAMVAVGLWAAQIGGRARWAVPLAFVAAMVAGAVAGFAGMHVPYVEPMVAASVVALGLLIAGGTRPALLAGAAVCALFAVFHGLAHAAELPPTVSAVDYVAGFAIATAVLHGAGLLAGSRLSGVRGARWVGAPIAVAGCALLAQVLAVTS
jgi:urease accessory protein